MKANIYRVVLPHPPPPGNDVIVCVMSNRASITTSYSLTRPSSPISFHYIPDMFRGVCHSATISTHSYIFLHGIRTRVPYPYPFTYLTHFSHCHPSSFVVLFISVRLQTFMPNRREGKGENIWGVLIILTRNTRFLPFPPSTSHCGFPAAPEHVKLGIREGGGRITGTQPGRYESEVSRSVLWQSRGECRFFRWSKVSHRG